MAALGHAGQQYASPGMLIPDGEPYLKVRELKEAWRPRVRPIYNEDFPPGGGALPAAFHVTNALPDSFLAQLDELRSRVPLDDSRPTCPRRFFQEWSEAATDEPIKGSAAAAGASMEGGGTWGSVARHYENGWVTKGLGECLDEWMGQLDLLGGRRLAAMPWFRFLEYGEGGSMDRHTDGSNAHPADPATRSVATMLVYLSSCADGGGGTSLHRKPLGKKKKNGRGGDSAHQGGPTGPARTAGKPAAAAAGSSDLIEVVVPARNSVLIFPHAWPHAGCEVRGDPKIALRAELYFTPSSPS